MMRSLFAGVSGLRNHQIRMDVIANNISNVNTAGFKMGRVHFTDVFSQIIRGAASPTDERGGINPQQIGLGSTVAAIDTVHQQGSLQVTGVNTHFAIDGEGFFIIEDQGQYQYTRTGAFDVDASGYLVAPTGGRVQGWQAVDGTLPTQDASTLTDVRIPKNETVAARATSELVYGNNLDSDSAVGDSRSTPEIVFDSKGGQQEVMMTFTKTGLNTWDWETTWGAVSVGTGTLIFDTDGMYQSHTGGPITFTPAGADVISITPDFSIVTQFSGESSVSALERDGYQTGKLRNFEVDAAGTITGVYTNGLTRTIAQVGLASFSNPGGLTKAGGSLYVESNNSGLRQIGAAGTAGRGDVAPGSLEMSNVDLSQEFTEMIITQRGFQANSRSITTSDEMLKELVNLKR